MVSRTIALLLLVALLFGCGESNTATPTDVSPAAPEVSSVDVTEADAASDTSGAEEDTSRQSMDTHGLDTAVADDASMMDTVDAVIVPEPALPLGPSRCDLVTEPPAPRPRRVLTPVVVFSELMYHPVDGGQEWLEVRNVLAVDVDLSGWRLDGGVRFTFPAGTLLSGGGRLVVAADPATFTQSPGALGPFEGKLDNGGERVDLVNNAGRLMDVVDYDDDAPWPVTPDGAGVSLAKRARHLPSGDPSSWEASQQLGGTPGALNAYDPKEAPVEAAWIDSETTWRLELSGASQPSGWSAPGYEDAEWETVVGATSVGGSLTEPVTVLATADNHVAVYLGASDGSGMRLLGRDSEADWASPEAFADTAGAEDHLFLVAWEAEGDAGSPQMLIAEVLTAAGALWGTTAAAFDVSLGPIGATPGGDIDDAAPSAETIADEVAESDALDGWSTPQAERPRSEGPWGGAVGAAFTSDAAFVWADTFESNSVTNQFETYALFRSVAPVLPPPSPTSALEAPLVTYARATFSVSEAAIEMVTEVRLTGEVDSGAVLYVNGVEVTRVAMPEGAITGDVLAAESGPHTLDGVTVPLALLVAGENVLAVSVHQSDTSDTSLVLDVVLSATLTPKPPEPSLGVRIDEISAGGHAPSWIELFNPHGVSVSTASCELGIVGGTRWALDVQVLAPGERVVVRGDALEFDLDAGDLLALWGPEQELLDGVRVQDVVRARDDAGAWHYPVEGTPGAPSAPLPAQTVVIHEVLYHAPPTQGPAGGSAPSPLEWVELHNTSDWPVSLEGAQLTDGIAFSFDESAMIPGGGFLIISRDGERPPGTPEEVLVLGPWEGALSNGGDGVTLVSRCGNPIDRVIYSDGGRWPAAADGGGSSLERRTPGGPGLSAGSWAASQESDRVGWQEVSYRAVVAPSSVGPDGQWQELIVGLLAAGEVLIDDLTVVRDPDGAAVQLIQDPGFDDPTSATWRWIGTHRHSALVADPDDPSEVVLKLVATAQAGHMHNHLETTLAGGATIQNGVEFEIAYRARWVSGSNQLNTRLYFNRLARTTHLALPDYPGTPGAVNTVAVEALGPALSQLRHHPAVPQAGEPVTVSVVAHDPQGIGEVTLWLAVDEGTYVDYEMSAAEGGRYDVTVPGFPLDAMVQMVVVAEDGEGAQSEFPPEGQRSRALFRVSAPVGETHGKRSVRIWMTASDSEWLHAEPNLMSNDKVGATVIYDDRDIFYDVGVRGKGSQRGRGVDARHGFALYFNADEPLLGGYGSAMVDRSQGVGYGQREWLLNQAMARAGSVSAEYNDLVHLVAPLEMHTGSAELQLARFGNTMLDAQFDEGGEGQLFEYELIYYPTTTVDGAVEGAKRPRPDQVVGTHLRGLGEDKESYRHLFLAKNNRRADNYTGLMARLPLFELPDAAFFEEVEQALDVDQWLRSFAFAALAGSTDQYGSGAQHNAQLYVRPSDGRLLYFPHDMDFFFGTPTKPVVQQGDLSRLLSQHRYKRAFCGHVLDIVQTSYNADYMAHWGAHMAALLPEQAIASYVNFLVARGQHVLYDAPDAVTVLVPPVTFGVTAPGEDDLEVTGDSVTLEGLGWVNVATVHQLEGDSETPLDLDWSSTTAWSAQLELVPGLNVITLVARNLRGAKVGEATLSVTSISIEP
jgi:hypothetical protein